MLAVVRRGAQHGGARVRVAERPRPPASQGSCRSR
jgi:hypothetical protein